MSHRPLRLVTWERCRARTTFARIFFVSLSTIGVNLQDGCPVRWRAQRDTKQISRGLTARWSSARREAMYAKNGSGGLARLVERL